MTGSSGKTLRAITRLPACANCRWPAASNPNTLDAVRSTDSCSWSLFCSETKRCGWCQIADTFVPNCIVFFAKTSDSAERKTHERLAYVFWCWDFVVRCPREWCQSALKSSRTLSVFKCECNRWARIYTFSTKINSLQATTRDIRQPYDLNEWTDGLRNDCTFDCTALS